MESLLNDLAEFYESLDAALQPTKQACGACGECCRKASKLRVYPLELQNIRRFVKDESCIRKFVDFSNNKVVKIWGDIEGHCPFQEGDRCSIYHVRPYFCRVYGHYNFRGSNLLKGCVYCGHSIIYYDRLELPLYEEFLKLMEKVPQLV
ncbi:YkgJ family cysteine cluster protein [Pelotomaculum propionicicum]|uniref:YkgJ family cysteine cluster protein n=1 Tax=Pelotomaculum propionicicum TaxID=258475 RepID=UPI003B78D45D